MSDNPGRPFDDEISPTQLAFWMGEINTKVSTLTNMLASLVSSESTKWEAFSKWRDNVNIRLSQGAEKMSAMDSEIHDQQDQITELRLALTTHLQALEMNGKPRSTEEVLKQFVSWPWLLENILVPILRWALILLLTYVVISAIPIPR